MNKNSLASYLPYFAVIFTSMQTNKDGAGYRKMSEKMVTLATQQSGFLGHDLVKDPFGKGMTVSYWKTREAIDGWKQNMAHIEAQTAGQDRWYDYYSVRICKVEKEYVFNAEEPA